MITKYNTGYWMKKMKTKKLVISLILSGALSLVGVSCFASDDEDYSVNSIRYYGSSTCQISDSTNREIYISSDLRGESPLAGWISENYAAVTSLAAEYGLPWEPIMAQGAIESDFGTSEEFIRSGNIFVLGPDGNGLNKNASYPNLELSWRALFEYLRLSARANRERIFSEENVRTPSLYIDAITAAGYSPQLTSGSNYAELLKETTTEIELISDRANLQSSKEILKNTLAMEGNIERNRSKGLDKYGNASERGSAECNCGGDAGASNVRWFNFWATNNSLYGSQKAPVIGTEAEKRLSANDYGLEMRKPTQALDITFRIKNGSGTIVDSDPYSAYPNGDFPHFLIDIKKKRVFQYFPINLSAATKDRGNIEKGIVIDIVGYTDEANLESSYYLWNTEKNSNYEWKYLAKLINAIYEESGSTLNMPQEGESAQIWEKVSSYLNLTEHKAAIKCSTVEDVSSSPSEQEAKRFVNYYNNTVSIDQYALPSNSKSMPASFVAYFVSRFTSLNTENVAWGEPRDVVKNLANNYASLETGNDPAPFTVFSSTDIGALCGAFNCGSTGVVLGINNGLATTVEQNYLSGKAEVKKRSLASLKNDKTGTSFIYLRSVLNDEEINRGKMGQ